MLDISAFEAISREKLDFAVPAFPSSDVWMYCRYSDKEHQTDASIEQQVLAVREAAAKNGHEIPDDAVFADAGIRGWIESRPALDRMVQLIKDGKRPRHLYGFDTSRFARDLPTALKLRNFFELHDVCVHFVADGIASNDPSYKLNHAFRAIMDEQHSDTIGKNVKRAHINQFEKGFLALAKTYGYDHEDIIDPAHADSFNSRRRIGVMVKINPFQAKVVRMIVELYLAGDGYTMIARHLNDLGIKSPRRPTKHEHRLWSASSVRTILSNDRYIGFVRYGVTESKRDATKGKVKHKKRPKEEWRETRDPDLAIISDEEFRAVQELRKSKDTLGASRAGGLNKAKEIYSWSSLLRCGSCGGPMNIIQPETYMCNVAYKNGPCTNKNKLNRPSFESMMREQLSQLIREARSFDAILDALMVEILKQQAERERLSAARAATLGGAQSKLSQINQELGNLAVALGRVPDSETILGRLRQLEAEKKLLEQDLQQSTIEPGRTIDRAEVAEFLSSALENLHGVLAGDPHTYRAEIRKRVKGLKLTPITIDNQPAHEITGDLELFCATDASKMVCSSGYASAHHFSPVLSLTGLTVKIDHRGKVLHIDRAGKAPDTTPGHLKLAA